MAEVVEMLALSPTMDEGTIAEWAKSEGDHVEEGEIIADVETDKATMEMESFFEGTLLKILAPAGDAVEVGQPIAIIGEEGEDISALLADLDGDGSSEEAEQAPAEEDDQGEEGEEKQEREQEDQEQTPEAEEQAAGEEPREAKEGDSSDRERIFASPLARRIADERGLDLENIQGSGPNGRIIKADVESAEPQKARGKAQEKEAPARPSPSQQPPAELEGEEIPLSQMRKTIAKRLRTSWQNAPHFFLTVSVDMAPAMEKRAEINAGLEEAEMGVKISVNDLIVKACAQALQQFPEVNVSFQDDHIAQYDTSNIGVAVAVDEGLVTPVIRNAESKSLSHIARETRELAERARDKDLMPEDYSGGTFTVSNLGMFGIDHFTAVINPPQAAILACGAVKEVPVVEDGELAVGTRMKVTLSCDHRAVDGATGSEFLQVLVNLLENPLLLMV
ncbi:MAG: pyruvate dehydrogenase complex dihydrolipoamide acetyltransferase [Myxococcota bacterium]